MEKRAHSRIISSIPIKIKTENQIFETTTIDISQKGISFYLPIKLKTKNIFLDINYCNLTYENLPANIIFSKLDEEKNNILHGVQLLLNEEQQKNFQELILEASKRKFEFNEIINANIENIFKILKNFERYPKFMKYVKEIKVYNQKDNLFTEWNIELDGVSVKWKQSNFIDEENKIIKFYSTEGDFDHYEGYWQLKKIAENKTKLTLYIEIIWGLPSVEKFFGSSLKIKTTKALKGMVLSIKKFFGRQQI